MATNFAITWKNKTIDSLLGRASNTSILAYLNGYAGAIVADPTTAVSLLQPTVTSGAPLGSSMSQPAVGVSSLGVSKLTSATGVVAMTLGNGRIFDAGQIAQIDTTATVAGGGGGVICPTLTSSAGVVFQFDQFSLKMPSSLGTVFFNDALRDALVSMWTVLAANVGLGNAGVISIYSGTAPANANLAATGTLLWSVTVAATGASWNAASGGSAALVSSLAAAAVATGTATYARFVKGGYTLQGTVGTAAADFIVDNTTMVNATTYNITNATITI